MAENKPNYGVVAVCFIIGYFAFQALFVSIISKGAGLDDAELASNMSFWNWGYGGSQPPLYTWIAFGVEKLLGLHFFLLQIIKFGFLASTFLAVYTGLRLLSVRPVVAGAAMLALFLLPQISWESQRALIHSVLGTAGSAWTFAAFCLFIRKPSWFAAILLGLASTSAILGKYNGGLFLLALFGGAACTKEIHSYFKNRYFPVAIATALITMAPALLFMLFHPNSIVARANKLAIGKSGNFFVDRFMGLTDFILAAFSFVSVALLISIILFGIHLLKKGLSFQGTTNNEKLAENFLFHILAFSLFLIVVAIIILGITNVKDRWLQPLLFLAPAYFALVLSRLCYSLKYVRAFGVSGAVCALIVPFVLYLNIATAYNRITPPEQLLDYAKLNKVLHKEGPFVMVLGQKPQLPGNLRLLDPTLKTLHSETPSASERLVRPLMVIWSGDKKLPTDLKDILSKANFKIEGQINHVQIGFCGKTDARRDIYYVYLP